MKNLMPRLRQIIKLTNKEIDAKKFQIIVNGKETLQINYFG